MTFPIPPQIWAERPTTSIWTDFTNAYDGKTLIGSYSTGALMNDWTLLPSSGTPTIFRVESAAGSISGQALHLVGGANINVSSYFTWNYIPAVSDLDMLVGLKPIVLVPALHAAAVCRVLQPSGTTPTQSRIASVESGGAPRLLSGGGLDFDVAETSNAVTAGNWCWLRLNVVGDVMKAKFWLRSASEPADWMNTLETTKAPAAGAVGVIFNRRITAESLIDFFSVSIDGTPAYAPGL